MLRINHGTYILGIAGYGGEFGARMALVVIVAGAKLGLLAGNGQAGKVHGNGRHRSGHRALRSCTDVRRIGVAPEADAHPFPVPLQLGLVLARSSIAGLQALSFCPPLATLLLHLPHCGIALWGGQKRRKKKPRKYVRKAGT